MRLRVAALAAAFLTTAATLSSIGSESSKIAIAKAEGNCAVFRITGYASSEFPGRTRDGTRTIGNEWSLVAVDPNVVPLGSMVHVEGYGTFRAADTGGGVRGRHLDILVYTRAEAFALTGYANACWW